MKIIDKKRAREDCYISKNLRREAKILQEIRHPHIIQLLEVLETDNFYYLVMEYCAGKVVIFGIAPKLSDPLNFPQNILRPLNFQPLFRSNFQCLCIMVPALCHYSEKNLLLRKNFAAKKMK